MTEETIKESVVGAGFISDLIRHGRVTMYRTERCRYCGDCKGLGYSSEQLAPNSVRHKMCVKCNGHGKFERFAVGDKVKIICGKLRFNEAKHLPCPHCKGVNELIAQVIGVNEAYDEYEDGEEDRGRYVDVTLVKVSELPKTSEAKEVQKKLSEVNPLGNIEDSISGNIEMFDRVNVDINITEEELQSTMERLRNCFPDGNDLVAHQGDDGEIVVMTRAEQARRSAERAEQ